VTDLLDEAVYLLRQCEPRGGYLGGFSGGKDSIALHRCAEIAGVRVAWQYAITTIDPPEVVRFIRRQYPHVLRTPPRHGNFFTRMRHVGVVPTRFVRWCCHEYKETRGPLNSVWINGVRREESGARASRPAASINPRTRRLYISPLVDWDSEYLWDFIRSEGLAYPSLYDEGFRRLGCVGCPLSSRASREMGFARWPRLARLWRRSIEYVWAHQRRQVGQTWEEYYEAWMSDRVDRLNITDRRAAK